MQRPHNMTTAARLLLLALATCDALRLSVVGRSPTVQMMASSTNERIEEMISDNKCERSGPTCRRPRPARGPLFDRLSCELTRARRVMLFMKGNKLFPQCGFSNTAVMILKSITEDFETFDVLADNDIRDGIKQCVARPPRAAPARMRSRLFPSRAPNVCHLAAAAPASGTPTGRRSRSCTLTASSSVAATS